MDRLSYWLLKQSHLIWIVSIINIGLGLVIPDFNTTRQTISEVALEAPVFAITHRLADVVIGLSMCGFAIGIARITPSRLSSAALTAFLFGIGMISAGIWTLESPLHLLYNLSIVMIALPIALALEFKTERQPTVFETLCVTMTLVHTLMFWLIYAGFIPHDYNGLIQRLWAAPTMAWFGLAAHWLLQQLTLGREDEIIPDIAGR